MAQDVTAVWSAGASGDFNDVRGAPARPLRRACLTLLAATTLVTLLRLWLGANLGLTDDEAYYRTWALAPALSYLDHPPFVAWLIAAGRSVIGDSELGVRVLAPLILAFGVALQWHLATLLLGPRAGLYSAWLVLAVPLLGVGGVIITPDTPSVLFYGLVILGLAELDRSGNANWWLAVGLFAGFGLLSKYTNLFAGVSVFLWVLAVPANRRWLRTPQFWIGGVIAALMSAPVLVWNAQNGWASFAKQFGRAGAAAHGFSPGYVAEFLMGFPLLGNPLVILLAGFGCLRLVKAYRANGDSRAMLVVASGLPLLLYFFLHSLHGRVQLNWVAPLYPSICLSAAAGLEGLAKRFRRPVFIGAVGLGLTMTAVIYSHALAPLFQVRRDPTAQMRGWRSLAKGVSALGKDATVYTSSYATTAQLAFQFKGSPPVGQINEPLRHLHLPRLGRSDLGKPGLYVELHRRADEGLLQRCFENVRPVGSVTRPDETANGAVYDVYSVSGFRNVYGTPAAVD